MESLNPPTCAVKQLLFLALFTTAIFLPVYGLLHLNHSLL